MEINNVQIGQEFASTNLSMRIPANDSTPERSEVDSRSTRKNGEQGLKRSENVEAIGSSEEKVQANNISADISREEVTSSRLQQAVVEIESFLQTQNRNLAFDFDEKSQRPIVTVKDSSSGDVIRQIPSEEVLKMAERIRELQEDVGSRVGVFVNSQA